MSEPSDASFLNPQDKKTDKAPVDYIPKSNFSPSKTNHPIEPDVEMLPDYNLQGDFSEEQKRTIFRFIDELLEEKLAAQKERMMSNFQNLQIEMIRQFQTQYEELSSTLAATLESGQKDHMD